MHQVLQDQCLLILLLPLFRRTSHPHVKINKMVSKHTANYHHSPSVLTWRIHPLMFPQTLELHLSSKILLHFFLEATVRLTMVGKKWWGAQSTRKIICKSKIWKQTFYSCPQGRIHPQVPALPPMFCITHPAHAAFLFENLLPQ